MARVIVESEEHLRQVAVEMFQRVRKLGESAACALSLAEGEVEITLSLYDTGQNLQVFRVEMQRLRKKGISLNLARRVKTAFYPTGRWRLEMPSDSKWEFHKICTGLELF